MLELVNGGNPIFFSVCSPRQGNAYLKQPSQYFVANGYGLKKTILLQRYKISKIFIFPNNTEIFAVRILKLNMT